MVVFVDADVDVDVEVDVDPAFGGDDSTTGAVFMFIPAEEEPVSAEVDFFLVKARNEANAVS